MNINDIDILYNDKTKADTDYDNACTIKIGTDPDYIAEIIIDSDKKTIWLKKLVFDEADTVFSYDEWQNSILPKLNDLFKGLT
ncbi:MAG: hypothetical protein DRP08_08025 [Candidatus Aenigmatarchaeota archaeon]|nr:MAG: hypothetical protein DRP08_08025 [Candidatus Aenigmarchaeota archaeon]